MRFGLYNPNQIRIGFDADPSNPIRKKTARIGGSDFWFASGYLFIGKQAIKNIGPSINQKHTQKRSQKKIAKY